MVGRSKEMQKVYALIGKVADTPANVTHPGRERDGKGTGGPGHPRQQRTAGPSPSSAINCGGIPENLLESELFGHVKGSFTGAFADQRGPLRGRPGRDDLPRRDRRAARRSCRSSCCASCRRRPSAAHRRHPRTSRSTSRIVSATNQDLPGEGQAGRVPRGPLLPAQRDPDPHPAAEKAQGGHPASGAVLHREIREGVRQGGQADLHVRPGAAHALPLPGKHPGAGKHHRAQRRPGELEHHPARRIWSLPKQGNGASPRAAPPRSFPMEGSISTGNWSSIEREIIRKALERARGSKTKAASLLGVSFPSLRHRLEKLNMDNGDGEGK
ncbi:MAG: sigma 54-interacting transcriptional regulator [Desulfobacterales bacterium]|nr:sigma 54-interacting transcriptional regulator [Desulfobacterales bacterium]